MTSTLWTRREGECQHPQQETLKQGAAYVTHLRKWIQSLHLNVGREEEELCSACRSPDSSLHSTSKREKPFQAFYRAILFSTNLSVPTWKRIVYKQLAIMWEGLSHGFEFLKNHKIQYKCISKQSGRKFCRSGNSGNYRFCVLPPAPPPMFHNEDILLSKLEKHERLKMF